MPKPVSHITVALPVDIIADIKRLADDQGLTATAALRQALEISAFFQGKLRGGSTFLLQEPNGTLRQIVLR